MALQAGHPGGFDALYKRYASYVQSVLVHTLGLDSELEELLQEVFVRAFKSIDSIRSKSSLKPWLAQIAVHTARHCIRRRKRRSWLRLGMPTHVKNLLVSSPSIEERETLRSVYAILDRLNVEYRIAFALRFIEGMSLAEIGEACGVSEGTVKRRIAQAQKRFLKHAKHYPILAGRIERGDRWKNH